MTGNNRSPHDAQNAPSGGHLSDDQLNLLIDRELSLEESRDLHAHLATCADCQQNFDDLVALRDLLRSMPQVATPRSFQLTPEMAGQKAKSGGRFSNWLLGAMPALRTATVVLALAFGSVIAYDIVSETPDSGQQVSDQGALVAPTTLATTTSAPTEVRAAPTNTPAAFMKAAPTETEGSDGETADEASDDSGGADNSAPAESAPRESDTEAPGASQSVEDSATAASDIESEEISMTMAEASPPATETATATATATASPIATATTTSTPEPTVTVALIDMSNDVVDGPDESGLWRFFEAILGLLLAIGVALLIFATRAKSRAA